MSRKTIMIVDDEEDIRDLLQLSLNKLGLDTVAAANIEDANQLINSDRTIDFCLTDVRLPDGSGLEIVQTFKDSRPDIPIAVMTAFDSSDIAVEAMKAGAFDFLSKPIRHNRLKTMLENALNAENRPATKTVYGLLVGDSELMVELRKTIDKVARSLAPVLISGESGTGKELVARAIHNQGSRSSGPFVPVNCGAIPSELMESEFFGHAKGSFTGAIADKKGLFQSAENGTLFLDEIADLPLHMQVKLLRSIQEKSVRPVGTDKEIATNVRIVSATHKDLEEEVASGRFRHDLFYRVNVIAMELPSLQQRKDDLPVLVEHLLHKLAEDTGQQVDISDSAIEALQNYHFPGNVRELENILQRAAALCDEQSIQVENLGLEADNKPTASTGATLETYATKDIDDLEAHLQGVEQSILKRVMEEENGNRAAVAKRLKLTQRQLRYKLSKLGLED